MFGDAAEVGNKKMESIEFVMPELEIAVTGPPQILKHLLVDVHQPRRVRVDLREVLPQLLVLLLEAVGLDLRQLYQEASDTEDTRTNLEGVEHRGEILLAGEDLVRILGAGLDDAVHHRLELPC